MKQKNRMLMPVVWISLFVIIYAYCQYFLSFNYFFVEQLTFFRFSGEYALSTIYQPGGLAHYIGDFLTQFYLYPGVGPLISAVLAVLLTALVDISLKQFTSRYYIPFLSAIPALACIWIETDFNYYLSGTVSLILGIGIFLAYLKSLRVFPFYVRLVLLMVLSWPLDYLLGPNALLTVGLCVLAEIRGTMRRSFLSLFAIPWAMICPVYLFYMEQGKELQFQLLPSGYYLEILPIPFICYLPWIVIVLDVLLAKVVSCSQSSDSTKTLFDRVTGSVWAIGFQFIAIVSLMHWGVKQVNSTTNYEAKIFDYYVRTNQWNALLQDKHLRAARNYMHTCYQNLALSSLNMMGDKLFACPQTGYQGMLIRWNKAANTSTLLSDVCWQAGDVALAQEMAFEGMVASRDGVNPRLLMRLVQTNLVTGNYPVAEKYIELLSATYSYAQQAEIYRKMLYNDQAVLADAELGPRKKNMSKAVGLTSTDNFVPNLTYIMDSNPAFVPAFHYYGCTCLLIKDINSFSSFITRYRQSPALSKMPVHFQEAIVLAFENESERWEELGVTPQVKKRFEQYRETFLANRSSSVLERKMAGQFQDTYWYYFMFKNNKR